MVSWRVVLWLNNPARANRLGSDARLHMTRNPTLFGVIGLPFDEMMRFGMVAPSRGLLDLRSSEVLAILWLALAAYAAVSSTFLKRPSEATFSAVFRSLEPWRVSQKDSSLLEAFY